jgi:multidrug efflux system membrane fusion protein
MAETQRRSRWIGLLIGVPLVVVAVYTVFFVKWKTEPPAEPPPIRPLKTMVIGSPLASAGRKYPGRVRANEEVNLAFQVAGPLIEFPVKKGQEVQQGELLARIDPRDFQNDLQAKQGVLAKAKADLEKIERLVSQEMAAEQELIDTKAAFEVAKAQTEIAAKALEDTHLRAPFAGVIANTFVKNFENVQAKQPILSLQDVSSVTIEVNVPEETVALSRNAKDKIKVVATFDYLPGREFDVTLKEFATEADPLTQTFLGTFVMPAPDDVFILPGMTATLETYLKEGATAEDAGYAVPIDAVPIDGLGQYYVWIVKQHDDGTGTVHRVNVTVGDMMGNDILVLEGIEQGDRIATAGVHVLQEGQRVRLLEAAQQG